MIFDGSFRVGERLNESTLAARLRPGAGLCARGFRRWENTRSSPLHVTVVHSSPGCRLPKATNSTTFARRSTMRSAASVLRGWCKNIDAGALKESAGTGLKRMSGRPSSNHGTFRLVDVSAIPRAPLCILVDARRATPEHDEHV